MACFRYISANTLHKGDDDGDTNNKDSTDSNNNNEKSLSATSHFTDTMSEGLDTLRLLLGALYH
jgi:hypothetical protein